MSVKGAVHSDENDGEDCDQQSLPLSKAIAKKRAEQDSHFFNNSEIFFINANGAARLFLRVVVH